MADDTTFGSDEDYSNEGNHGTTLGNISPGADVPESPTSDPGIPGSPTSDPGLISMVIGWMKANPQLGSMIMGSVSGAFKNQNDREMANASFDQKVAYANLLNQQNIDAQKRYSDSITNMAPPAQGIIGRSMINNLRGIK